MKPSRRFHFFLALMFPAFYGLRVTDEPGGGTASSTAALPAAVPDIQAEINKALAEQADAFAARFKEATGHASFDEFKTAQAKAKGDEQRLLDERTAELSAARAELERQRISAAILAESGAAVDPGDVLALLAGQGKVESGVVTVGGKPVANAVADLLKAKPHLAKAAGGQGSGAGAGGTGAGGAGDLKAQYAEAKAKGDVNAMLSIKAKNNGKAP